MFGDSRNSNILFILVLVILAISNGRFDLMHTLLTLPGLICALAFHEYAHAKTSDRLGDPTPESQGRLTLNPLAHLDPLGTVFLIFAGFGWGKPVEVNGAYYRNPARDTMLVALAGPVSNFIQGFIWLLIYGLMTFFVPEASLISGTVGLLYSMVLYAGIINISLGVFNFLPLPPLDGSKILRYFLKGNAREFIYSLERYSTIILMVLFATNITSIIISPIIDWIVSAMMILINLLLGVIAGFISL